MTGFPPANAAFARLLPDTPAAHAAMKAAREAVRRDDVPAALALLGGPDLRETPLAGLLRADLLLARGQVREAENLALALARTHGDTAQALLCAGHAALARGDRDAAGRRFARAFAVDPGRLAAQVNMAALSPDADRPFPPDLPCGGPVAAATSLPPTTDQRHRAAVASFVAAGFSPVVSVNTAAEIEALWRKFPEVVFVPGPDAAARDLGRPYAALGDLLAAGVAAGAEAVAIVNADIVLVPPEGLAERIGRAARGGAAFACRVDVAGLAATTGQYHDVGFDLCAVDAAVAGRLDVGGFHLGLPWWDYALPLAVLAAGGRLGFAAAPVLRHPVHAQAWSHRHFVALGRLFARRFCPGAGDFLFPAGELATGNAAEACLAGIGARAAAFLRGAPEVFLGPIQAYCPHDPGYAAAALPLTRVDLEPF
ncbi:hypothetical protein DFW101_0199 [Solidesulfovibrio carbinoliphilus subsp. oakridgensis]|uniref:Uncharacterized protein n=1 Tax=Solidesulfovibrio carbinoliphilus subsp. oakridgensis TaxID=694327 RepID=G7QCR0_9BACT|nr:hypothetical protein [Solidesulfovibrio carbinoliphilus]EHJ46216.1 hypothetical protein DFW101_0199 [Solidesulfovibrio carbinoliphilus subsp. oakridgensis]